MHPLVRDLYKRVVLVARDYPMDTNQVKQKWKEAIRNPDNCPSCYNAADKSQRQCQAEIKRAVAKGRHYVKEMIGIIQIKKYRTMKQRYSSDSKDEVQQAMKNLESQGTKPSR